MKTKDIIIGQSNTYHNALSMMAFEDGKLTDIRMVPLDSQTEEVKVGEIYLGRVEKIVPSLNAAFIEVKKGVSCYYPLKANSQAIFTHKIPSAKMVQGDKVIVQIEKEAIKTKQATVTSNINFTGTGVVLTSQNHTIGASSKIPKKKRQELLNSLNQLEPKGFGIIARTNAAYMEISDLYTEIEQLSQEYHSLITMAQTRPHFTLLKGSVAPWITFITDVSKQNIGKITTDNEGVFRDLTEYLKQYHPQDLDKIKLYQDEYPLEKLYSFDAKIKDCLHKKVWMKSGAYLVIEATEALTVIDVNSGKAVTNKNMEESYLKVNLEAAQEAARQIRLRNISGIIIIDFINLKSKDHMSQVLDLLQSECKKDRVLTSVAGVTKLQLVEITRKKTYQTLFQGIQNLNQINI